MKPSFKKTATLLSVIALTVVVFAIGSCFEVNKERESQRSYTKFANYRDPELIRQIDRLQERLIQESPERLGLLKGPHIDESMRFLPRSLVPPKLPIHFWPNDEDVGNGYPAALVRYGKDGKATSIEFSTARYFLFIAINKDAVPTGYASARKICDSPKMYFCFYDDEEF